MTNNNVLRRIRDIFDFSDAAMITIFGLADLTVTRDELIDWLRKDDDSAVKNLPDKQLATFLNGLINHKRGNKAGAQPTPENNLSNNSVFRKIKIALKLEADDVLAILKRADFSLSRHELSALFRKKGHKHYRECKDQILSSFLQGLQLEYRGAEARPESNGDTH